VNPVDSGRERLQDLLVKRTLEGIDVDEARELAAMLERFPDVDPDQFDQTVGLLDALPLGNTPALPPSVSEVVMARIARDNGAAPVQPAATAWPWLAVAAMALIAFAGWWQVLTPSTADQTSVQRIDAAPLDSGPAIALNDFQRVDTAADMISVAWSGADDASPAGVQGVVRWSSAAQLGYMELAGLPRNDPDVEQYQLWIFDATRSDAFPVDGGVFDIPTDGPNVVAIRAAVPVREATLFAVTVEAPGGVVVSGRERLVALAQVP
jgi:hypothetical protein